MLLQNSCDGIYFFDLVELTLDLISKFLLEKLCPPFKNLVITAERQEFWNIKQQLER